MSVGKDKYDARRERELLDEQERLLEARRRAAGNAFLDLAVASLTAFFDGRASLLVEPGNSHGFLSIRFTPPTKGEGDG